MTRCLCYSSAARALLRALVERADCGRDWVLLSDIESTDWRSLTFTGERHRIGLKFIGADAQSSADRLTAGLEDAEFNIPGQIVADIAVVGFGPTADLSVAVTIEALTVEE